MLFQTIDRFGILQELQKHGSPDIVMALVGNKADLNEKREVPVQVSEILLGFMHSVYHKFISIFLDITHALFGLQDGIDYAEKNGMFFIETSAKTADNINQLFEVLLTLKFQNLCFCQQLLLLVLTIYTIYNSKWLRLTVVFRSALSLLVVWTGYTKYKSIVIWYSVRLYAPLLCGALALNETFCWQTMLLLSRLLVRPANRLVCGIYGFAIPMYWGSSDNPMIIKFFVVLYVCGLNPTSPSPTISSYHIKRNSMYLTCWMFIPSFGRKLPSDYPARPLRDCRTFETELTYSCSSCGNHLYACNIQLVYICVIDTRNTLSFCSQDM